MPICARDVMKTAVRSVRPDMSLAELEDLLIAERISGAPVVENDQLIGIISRSDVVRSLSLARSLTGLMAEAQTPSSGFAPGTPPEPLPSSVTATLAARTVREAMVADPVTVAPDTPIEDVAALFVHRHLHRVLVTDGRRLRGVISSLDLVALIADGRLHAS